MSESRDRYEAVASLERLQLESLALQREANSLKLAFVNESGTFHELHLTGVYQISLSRHPGEDGPFVIGEVWIARRLDGAKEVLEALKYGFVDDSGQVFSGAQQALHHFHLEGDVVLDVICESFSLGELPTLEA